MELTNTGTCFAWLEQSAEIVLAQWSRAYSCFATYEMKRSQQLTFILFIGEQSLVQQSLLGDCQEILVRTTRLGTSWRRADSATVTAQPLPEAGTVVITM
jgi:hypothetical protein